MKDIYELTDMGTASVAAITPKVIAKTLEEIHEQNMVWSQLYKTNRDLMNNGGTQVEFPVEGSGFVVYTNMSAGDTITASAMTYSTVSIAVKKQGVGLGILKDAVRQANRDVIAESLKGAGREWDKAVDKMAFEAMFPPVTVSTSEATGATVTTSSVIVGISTYSGTVTSFSVTPSGTTVTFSATGSLVGWAVGSTASKVIAPTTTGSILGKDILLLRSKIQGAGYSPDTLIMNYTKFAELLYNDSSTKIMEAWAYPEAFKNIKNGVLGKLFGMDVLVTDRCPHYAVIEVDSKNLGYQVIRKDLAFEKDEITGMASDKINFWGFAEKNFGVVVPKACGAVIQGGSVLAANIVTTSF